MADFSMKGTGGVACVTMPLDEATKTVIGKNYDSAKGKAVSLTGNNTVGYGSNGDPLFGVMCKAEPDGFATVQVSGFACDIAASEAAIGKTAAVDGSGGIKSAADGVIGRGFITSVDSTAGTADIII